MQSWSLCYLLIHGSEMSVYSHLYVMQFVLITEGGTINITLSPTQAFFLCPQLLHTSATSAPLTTVSLCDSLLPRDCSRIIPGILACDCYLFSIVHQFQIMSPSLKIAYGYSIL